MTPTPRVHIRAHDGSRAIIRISENTRRSLAGPRPRWRGVSHLVAAGASVPAGWWLVAAAPAGAARVGAAVFAVCIAFMFTASALVHLRRWSPRWTERLFRLDHTGIYLAIAGTATPIAVTALDGAAAVALLTIEWLLVAVGIVVTWLPFPPPRGFSNTVFLTLGWLTLPFVPLVWMRVGAAPVVWLVVGGLCYTVGAAIVGLRRPDPAPRTFGYHEIWHLLVIVAVAAHFVMVHLTVTAPAA